MKKSFLSIALLSLFIILAGCNSSSNISLEGKWKKANVDKDIIVVEFKGKTWQYSKNNKISAKGMFKLDGNKLTLSEEVSGHEHNEAEEKDHNHDNHTHAEEENHDHDKAHSHENEEAHEHGHEHSKDVHYHDMVYKFELNETELKLIKGKSTSIYNKMK